MASNLESPNFYILEIIGEDFWRNFDSEVEDTIDNRNESNDFWFYYESGDIENPFKEIHELKSFGISDFINFIIILKIF